jgi:3-oxoacyl-[acyl-carrier protein] reductase
MMAAEPLLAGMAAVVTGSSMGIGAVIAERMASAGARVVVNSRDPRRASDVAAELVAAGHEAIGVGADVTDPDGPARLVDTCVEAFGTLDVLVNNAGIPLVRPAEDITASEWSRLLDLNLTAPFRCAQAAARVMLPRRRGVIVNISSIYGAIAIPGRTAYSTAKHGLDGLTQALAVEWADRGVRVVSVNPAYVATRLVKEAMNDGGFSAVDLERRTPLGRLASPVEVADTVVFLASHAAAYITGVRLPVDGGWLAYGGW